jgi:hypothetical protein
MQGRKMQEKTKIQGAPVGAPFLSIFRDYRSNESSGTREEKRLPLRFVTNCQRPLAAAA